MMTPGHLLIQRVIQTGHTDAEAGQHIAQALQRWDRDGGDGAALLRYLGIPTTAAKRRQAVRDYWLAAASDALGGETLAERAGNLSQAVVRFERQWFRLRHCAAIPDELDEVSGCLFLARQAAPPPGVRQLRNILEEAFSNGNFQAIKPRWQGVNPP
jgi:hypothetical protein